MTLENIKLFFQPSYLFNPYPSYDMKFFVYLVTFFGILIILGLALFVSARKNKKKKYKVVLFSTIYNWLFWIGFGGLFFLFFRYEGIAFISMRFVLLLWLLVFILWGTYILVFYKKGYKKILKEHKEQIEKEKYFRKK